MTYRSPVQAAVWRFTVRLPGSLDGAVMFDGLSCFWSQGGSLKYEYKIEIKK